MAIQRTEGGVRDIRLLGVPGALRMGSPAIEYCRNVGDYARPLQRAENEVDVCGDRHSFVEAADGACEFGTDAHHMHEVGMRYVIIPTERGSCLWVFKIIYIVGRQYLVAVYEISTRFRRIQHMENRIGFQQIVVIHEGDIVTSCNGDARVGRAGYAGVSRREEWSNAGVGFRRALQDLANMRFRRGIVDAD